jgi:hypothetical protein
MRRREFMAGVLLTAAMRPARAQQRATPRRIAIFHPAIPAHLIYRNRWRDGMASVFP